MTPSARSCAPPRPHERQHPPCERKRELNLEIAAELKRSPYYSLRRITCEFRNGVLTIQGRVPSYFLKQLALALAQRCAKGRATIDDQVEVVT